VADPEVHYAFEEPNEETIVNWNYFVATVSGLRLLQKLTKSALFRVRELLNAKMDSKYLKKLLNCNPVVKHYVLKILKSGFRLYKTKR
jgi:hypothetical protein